MKKIFYLIFIPVTLLLVSSCNKDNIFVKDKNLIGEWSIIEGEETKEYEYDGVAYIFVAIHSYNSDSVKIATNDTVFKYPITSNLTFLSDSIFIITHTEPCWFLATTTC